MIETELTKNINIIKRASFNKYLSITKAFVEQGLSSLGSFSFFFILARWLGSEKFGQFSAIWISVQVLTSIAMAWVYLPVTSKAVSSEEEDSFYGVCLQRLVKLFALVPILIALALYFTAKEMFILPTMLGTIVILGAVIMTVDFLRYYLIRRGHKMAVALLVSARWGGGISLVLWLYFLQNLTVENAVACMLAGNILALIVTIFTIKYLRCNIKLVKNSKMGSDITRFSKPLLFQTIGNSFFVTVFAFSMRNWISTAAYGAFMAIRSICNIVSPLLQMINSHYSVYLTKKTDIKHNHLFDILLSCIGLSLICLFWVYKDIIIEKTIGPSYSDYSYLLPLIMLYTILFLFNTYVCANIRRLGNNQVFSYIGVLNIIFSLLFAFIVKYTGSIKNAILILLLLSIIRIVILKLYNIKCILKTRERGNR